MEIQKYLVWHTNYGIHYWSAFLIPNHYSHSLKSFCELLAEARKHFPDLKDVEAECRTVIDSPMYKNCPVLHFHLKHEPTDEQKAAFTICENQMPHAKTS